MGMNGLQPIIPSFELLSDLLMFVRNTLHKLLDRRRSSLPLLSHGLGMLFDDRFLEGFMQVLCQLRSLPLRSSARHGHGLNERP